MERWESQMLIYMKLVGKHIAKLLLVNDFKPMVKAKIYLICITHSLKHVIKYHTAIKWQMRELQVLFLLL